MKVKRFTKLALAGVGLAATAATLTTATYAWYVTNSKVEATGVQGQVASDGAGSLYIAYNNIDSTTKFDKPSEYGSKVTLEEATSTGSGATKSYTTLDADLAEGKFTSYSLMPQTRATSDRYNKSNLLDGYNLTGASDTPQARYNYAKAKYDATLVSSGTTIYYVDDNQETPATGAYNASTVYYDSTGTQVNGAGIADPDDQITANEFNATLKSTVYYTENDCAAGHEATNVYNENLVYFDKADQIKVGEWVDDNGYRTDDKSIEFKFWLRSSNGGNAPVVFKVDNTTTGTPSQVLQTTTGTTGMHIGETLIADAVYALRMDVSVFADKEENYDELTITGADAAAKQADFAAQVADGKAYIRTGSAGNYSYELVATDAAYDSTKTYVKRSFTTTTYQVDEIAKNSTGLADYASNTTTAFNNGIVFNDTSSGFDANAYYYRLMGHAPENTGASGASTDAGNTTWANVNLEANVDTLLVFKIWLEGSDKDCWDSCKGQSFTFDFEFTA